MVVVVDDGSSFPVHPQVAALPSRLMHALLSTSSLPFAVADSAVAAVVGDAVVAVEFDVLDIAGSREDSVEIVTIERVDLMQQIVVAVGVPFVGAVEVAAVAAVPERNHR